ncbi:MAG: NAD-dependent epimerase/dehydratase family protein [Paludibacter sp.]|nr:NAD-dependent epimerase/dehydratase family protein [Paludibacter sp.]
MKVLVTGANGLLGHHVVMQLQQANHDIRIILRGSREIYFDMKNIESAGGNFTDYETLKIAADGCDAIIHIAAVTSTNLLHYQNYKKINVDGSATIIKVADELKINRLVFVSTANTIGYGTKEQFSDEKADIEFPFTKSFYARSKVEAEKLFVKASKHPDRHIIIINPTFMIGSHDTKPSSGKLILMGYRKRLMFVPNGGKNFVAVSDVAAAICKALIMGKNGERYLASGQNLSFREFYEIQSREGGYKQKIVELPNFLLQIAAKAGDLLRLLGVKTELCSMNINQLTIREYYSNQKAKNEIELPSKSLEQAIKEALDWFEEKGKI